MTRPDATPQLTRLRRCNPGMSGSTVMRRRSQIYEVKLQAKLEAESHGLFVAIDVETEEEYEIGDESASAADRL